MLAEGQDIGHDADRAQRLDGLPVDPRRLRAAARPGAAAPRQQPADPAAAEAPDRSGRRVPDPVAGRADRGDLRPGEDQRRAVPGERPLRPAVPREDHAAGQHARHAGAGAAGDARRTGERLAGGQAQAAADRIRTELVEPGKVLRFAGGDYVDDLVQGKVAAAFGWSTDYERLVQAKPGLLFMIPNEGSLIWSDDILIPLAAQHPQNAHRFADYYYTPSTAAELTRAVRYTTPLAGTKSALTTRHPTDPLLTDDATSPMQRVAQLIFLAGPRARAGPPCSAGSARRTRNPQFTTIFESAKG